MDISKYNLEDLILSALKSEIDANRIYSGLAEKVKNAFLKEKLAYLAAEEEKHRAFLEELYKQTFPDRKPVIPVETPVPLPEIKTWEENMPLSEVIESAMEAEMAAHDFYKSLSERFKESDKTRKLMEYFANMEMGHYKLLEIERDNLKNFESYDEYWPLMHVGP